MFKIGKVSFLRYSSKAEDKAEITSPSEDTTSRFSSRVKIAAAGLSV